MEYLDLRLTNSTALSGVPFELFNPINSFAFVYNPDYTNIYSDYKPFGTNPSPFSGGINARGNVIFENTGDLLVIENAATAGTIARITGISYPYRSMLKQLETQPIQLEFIKMTTSSDPQQLVTPLTYFERVPLTDKAKKKDISITIDPFNKLPLVNEIKIRERIDYKSGFIYSLLPFESVLLNFAFNYI